MIFLSLIAFLPIAAMLMLKTYEKQQLDLTESSNVQQARLTAAALSSTVKDFSTVLTADAARRLLLNMNKDFDARIRILNKDGFLLADSSTLNIKRKTPQSAVKDSTSDSAASSADTSTPASAPSKAATSSTSTTASEDDTTPPKAAASSTSTTASEDDTTPSKAATANETSSTATEQSPTDTWLYRLFSLPTRVYRKYFRPPIPQYSNADYYTNKNKYDGIEIQQALSGYYGSATRISSGGQVSVTLYSAVPIYNKSGVIGVVLVSRSTYRILQNLYELRLELAKVFAWSLLAVLFVTIFLSLRISFPLKKLSSKASLCADSRGRIVTTKLPGNKRHDEIGELSRSFTVLLEKLETRIKFIEAFSADVAHEFKNPLAAIRSSAELANDAELSKDEHEQFIKSITDEVAHLQSLLSGVRKLSLIDSELDDSETERIPIDDFTKNIIERMKKRYPNASFLLQTNCENQTLSIAPDWFDRVLENLLDNAASFANTISISTKIENMPHAKSSVVIIVEDSGQGIAEEERDKLFNRFYSHRADTESSMHTGLGLSIVKAIVEATGGSVSISTSTSLGGACFTIIFPQK